MCCIHRLNPQPTEAIAADRNDLSSLVLLDLIVSPCPNIALSDAQWAPPTHRIYSVFNYSCAYETGAPEHGLLRFKDEQQGRTTSVMVYTNSIADVVTPTMPQAQGTSK